MLEPAAVVSAAEVVGAVTVVSNAPLRYTLYCFTPEPESVEAVHETLTWLQLTAVALTPVGTVGGVVSAHAGVVTPPAVDCAEVLLELSVAETV